MELYKTFKRIKYFRTIVLSSQINLSGIINGCIQQKKYGNIFVFEENGLWELDKNITTKNISKWELKTKSLELYYNKRLYDERLSTFVLKNYKNAYIKGKTYVCSNDLYTPIIRLFASSIILEWKITGPYKENSIITYYF